MRISTDDTADAKERKNDEAAAKASEYRGLASVIDRIAERHNEAFEKGSEANAATVASLVTMVDTLTAHLSMAITNVHNLAVNLANAISGQDQPETPQGNPMVEKMLVAAAEGLGRSVGTPAQQPKPNGQKP